MPNDSISLRTLLHQEGFQRNVHAIHEMVVNHDAYHPGMEAEKSNEPAISPVICGNTPVRVHLSLDEYNGTMEVCQ